jgi:hypothetical protein
MLVLVTILLVLVTVLRRRWTVDGSVVSIQAAFGVRRHRHGEFMCGGKSACGSYSSKIATARVHPADAA